MTGPDVEPTRYRLSPAWRIEREADVLHLVGGDDALYDLGLDGANATLWGELDRQDRFARTDLSDADTAILEALLTAGIVVPDLPPRAHLKVAVIGDPTPLSLVAAPCVRVDTVAAADLVLLVRHTSGHEPLLRRVHYDQIVAPHLYIDIAYHHTLSLGPLVLPGETACVSCLYGRLRERWGEHDPAPSPGVVSDYPGIVEALVTHELGRIAAGDTSLVRRTVSWNLLARTSTSEILLGVAECPVCAQPNRLQEIPMTTTLAPRPNGQVGLNQL
jgi:bacteriocin biosynthesis cyclodehydratase domain-containing protein